VPVDRETGDQSAIKRLLGVDQRSVQWFQAGFPLAREPASPEADQAVRPAAAEGAIPAPGLHSAGAAAGQELSEASDWYAIGVMRAGSELLRRHPKARPTAARIFSVLEQLTSADELTIERSAKTSRSRRTPSRSPPRSGRCVLDRLRALAGSA
jgi:hypothetical protein